MDESDRALEAEFIRDPERHFRAVYDRFSGPLARFLFRFTGDAQSSEEILHDIFVQLLSGKFQSTHDGSLKAWLFAVAKNRGLNHVQRASKLVVADLESVPSETNIEAESIHRGLLDKLRTAEATLPAELKATWELRKQGLDYLQIAAALSIPIGTVKSRFSRLVECLRKEFRHESESK